MSGRGDYQGGMGKIENMTEREIEALFAGRAAHGEGAAGELARFIARAKAVLPEAIDPAVERRHLSAIVEAAQSVKVFAPVAPTGSRTRKRLVGTLFASLWVKVAAGAATALAATGGLAAANVLPAPAQDAVASVASHVGIDLPSRAKAESKQDKSGSEPSATQGSKVANAVHSAQQSATPGPGRGKAVSGAANENHKNGDNSNGQQTNPHADQSGDHGTNPSPKPSHDAGGHGDLSSPEPSHSGGRPGDSGSGTFPSPHPSD